MGQASSLRDMSLAIITHPLSHILFYKGSSAKIEFVNYSFGLTTSRGKDMMVLEVNPQNPQRRLIRRAAEILGDGGIIAYPTDSYYGIGCDIMNKKAIERVYLLKRRPKHKPFSFICSDLKNISQYAQVSNYAYKTMKRLLPGPYTFILEGSRLVPKIMLTKRKTAGIRVPDHAICLAIVEELGNPILSTSATNPDGTILESVIEIEESLGHALDLIIDGGSVSLRPSSVVSLIDDSPEIIREGQGDVSEFQ
jgi:tRNA threonylcarbamoyl adenosine modification protein (Sua5/YciO/YrdC/YwlC family)